jgi:hypothetical protein
MRRLLTWGRAWTPRSSHRRTGIHEILNLPVGAQAHDRDFCAIPQAFGLDIWPAVGVVAPGLPHRVPLGLYPAPSPVLRCLLSPEAGRSISLKCDFGSLYFLMVSWRLRTQPFFAAAASNAVCSRIRTHETHHLMLDDCLPRGLSDANHLPVIAVYSHARDIQGRRAGLDVSWTSSFLAATDHHDRCRINCAFCGQGEVSGSWLAIPADVQHPACVHSHRHRCRGGCVAVF